MRDGGEFSQTQSRFNRFPSILSPKTLYITNMRVWSVYTLLHLNAELPKHCSRQAVVEIDIVLSWYPLKHRTQSFLVTQGGTVP